MDEQQQRRVNEAAEQFAEAVRASFQAVSERGASAQQLNAELTQQFFDTVTSSSARRRPHERSRKSRWAPTWNS